MATYRYSEAAALLGVSDDTVRRWADAGRFTPTTAQGRAAVEGVDLARIARELAHIPESSADASSRHTSARNTLDGIVIEVKKDTVMAQVELCCGPFRIVSLMSSEAATALGLEPGARASATIKSTNVIVEVP